MKNSKLVLRALLNSLGVLVYVSVIGLVLRNGEKIFGKVDNFMAPILFLMLFVFSALVTSLLVFGTPIYYWFKDLKKEAVKIFFYTVAWLFLIVLAVFFFTIIL